MTIITPESGYTGEPPPHGSIQVKGALWEYVEGGRLAGEDAGRAFLNVYGPIGRCGHVRWVGARYQHRHGEDARQRRH
jgi:hypothetical protein